MRWGRKVMTYYVYMVSNRARLLYVGLTTDIENMLKKHRELKVNSFRGNFSFNKLVFMEEIHDVNKALEREQELKKASHLHKKNLISQTNPDWKCIEQHGLIES